VLALKDIKPPVTIEWTRHRDNRGSLMRRARIIEKRGRNLLVDDSGSTDWLWWPTINHYGDVRIVTDAKDSAD